MKTNTLEILLRKIIRTQREKRDILSIKKIEQFCQFTSECSIENSRIVNCTINRRERERERERGVDHSKYTSWHRKKNEHNNGLRTLVI